jgi:hypothetical protein
MPVIGVVVELVDEEESDSQEKGLPGRDHAYGGVPPPMFNEAL